MARTSLPRFVEDTMKTNKVLVAAGACLALAVIVTASAPYLFRDRRAPCVFTLHDHEVALAVLDGDGEDVRGEKGGAVLELNDRRSIACRKRDVLYILVLSSDGWSARAIQFGPGGRRGEWEIPLTDPWKEPPKPDAIPRAVWTRFMLLFPDAFEHPSREEFPVDVSFIA